MDDASAFQLHCYDAASFLNTWTFPRDLSITGGGPHSIYGYSFDDASAPSIYDSNPATDLVLQDKLDAGQQGAKAEELNVIAELTPAANRRRGRGCPISC